VEWLLGCVKDEARLLIVLLLAGEDSLASQGSIKLQKANSRFKKS
jgi:hypothetical protein